MARRAAPAMAPRGTAIDGSAGTRMRTSTDTRKARMKTRASASSVEEKRAPRAGESREIAAPRRLEGAPGRAALDGPAHGWAAPEKIDGQLPPFEFVGRLAPFEVARRLAAGLGDEGEVGRHGLEATGIGYVHLHAAAAPALPLVKGRLECNATEMHAR